MGQLKVPARRMGKEQQNMYRPEVGLDPNNTCGSFFNLESCPEAVVFNRRLVVVEDHHLVFSFDALFIVISHS